MAKSHTQAHMGRNQLVERLAAQVGSKTLAESLLKGRGHMTKDGKLTAAGRARNVMTAEERAKDRAAKATGKPTSAFTYNPRTNAAKARK
jgi:hypothetical protein